MTKKRPESTAVLFTQCRNSNFSSPTFSSLCRNFQQRIDSLAGSYPEFWQQDFVQVGQIGLFRAAKSFPITGNPEDFERYATTVIRRQMVDFYRSVIGKSIVEHETHDIDGNRTITKQPIFEMMPENTLDEEDPECYLSNYPSPVDYVSSTIAAIDINLCINESTMKKNNFSKREIDVFDLYFNKGYNVSEVAAKVKVTVSYASKIISKTRDRVQQLLAYSSNKYLN